jgi:hypothetical protein
MKLGGFIFTALVSAILGAILSYSAHDRLKALIDPTQEPLIAIVELVNSCQVPDSAFVVIDLGTGVKVPFVNSKARMRTFDGNSLQIQLNPKYPDVTFEGPKQVAQERMTMRIDCAQSERMEETFKALREQLGN